MDIIFWIIVIVIIIVIVDSVMRKNANNPQRQLAALNEWFNDRPQVHYEKDRKSTRLNSSH